MQNKNIINTGTSRGIGYEMALKFANEGHNVLALSRKSSRIFYKNHVQKSRYNNSQCWSFIA
mgnify:CR=1 FL=1